MDVHKPKRKHREYAEHDQDGPSGKRQDELHVVLKFSFDAVEVFDLPYTLEVDGIMVDAVHSMVFNTNHQASGGVSMD